ncbi:MAG: thioredoxin family protein [Bacteroidales bacterium]|nr:thioredoxin family protein [Bacteroidales bacterium]MCF8388017.1 thioredoxin family protein [Bacteroidales bacterium]MCF8398298.1 thioredoxin family protein [Bacteroidales bacterium]
MRKITLILLGVVLAVPALFSQNYNQEIRDTELNELVLIGECNRKGLKKNVEFKNYFRIYYDKHEPDYKEIKKIMDKIEGKDFEIMVVLGTWCKDSKKWVPPFFRVMDEAGVAEDKIRIVGVNSNKYAYTVDLSGLDIQRVPTFIFFDDEGEEVGRIVETPNKGLEKDIHKIVRKL